MHDTHKYLEVGICACGWNSEAGQVLGRLQVVPQLKGQKDRSSPCWVEMAGTQPKPLLPAGCSQSLPVPQPSASGLCHKGWPPLSGICDVRSCHMLKRRERRWARATELRARTLHRTVLGMRMLRNNWQIPRAFFPAADTAYTWIRAMLSWCHYASPSPSQNYPHRPDVPWCDAGEWVPLAAEPEPCWRGRKAAVSLHWHCAPAKTSMRLALSGGNVQGWDARWFTRTPDWSPSIPFPSWTARSFSPL